MSRLISFLCSIYFVSSLIVFAYFVPEKGKNFTYVLAKSVVKHLEQTPTKTDDPIDEILTFNDKFLNSLGFAATIFGHNGNTRSRVNGPVRVIRPTISEVKLYFYFVIITTCGSSLRRWDCEWCKLLGNHIKVVSVRVTKYYHNKSYIAVDSKRQKIILAYAPSTNAGNVFTAFDMNLMPVNEVGSVVKIHGGILKSILTDFKEIVAILRELTRSHSNYKIVIIGEGNLN